MRISSFGPSKSLRSDAIARGHGPMQGVLLPEQLSSISPGEEAPSINVWRGQVGLVYSAGCQRLGLDRRRGNISPDAGQGKPHPSVIADGHPSVIADDSWFQSLTPCIGLPLSRKTNNNK